MDIESLAYRFHETFLGMEGVRGQYTLPKTRPPKGTKMKGQGLTLHEDVTSKHWVDHLNGKVGLGVVPIRFDSTVVWGAIDVDHYDLDYSEVVKKVDDTPIILTKTKSGGLHIYLFTAIPVPAPMMIKKLNELATKLGFGGSEIFPKQKKVVAGETLGNWINMPYYNAQDTQHYAFDVEGEPLEAEEFLDLIEECRLTKRGLSTLKIEGTESGDAGLDDGPPCLQHLASMGFPPGARNNALMGLGVYYKKAHPDTWAECLEEANQKWMTPPLPAQEVTNAIRSLGRKDYTYKCEDRPLCDHCDKDVCFTRKYGISGETGVPALNNLVQIDTIPPNYYLEIDGKKVGPLSSEQLLQQSQFQKVVFERVGVVSPIIKPMRWKAVLDNLLTDRKIVSAPKESSSEGQLSDHLYKFLTGRGGTSNRDEFVLSGRVLTSDSHYYFRLSDFMDFLGRHRFFDYKPSQIAAIFRDQGYNPKQLKIKGKNISTWEVPPPDQPTEAPSKDPDEPVM